MKNRQELEANGGQLTDAQWAMLCSLRERYETAEDETSPEIGGYGALMVRFGKLWIGIEKDGYAHS